MKGQPVGLTSSPLFRQPLVDDEFVTRCLHFLRSPRTWKGRRKEIERSRKIQDMNR